jgi:hypothetical protein
VRFSLEHRDDLSELLLNGLPHEEREHVIEVIKQGDEAKLRRLRDGMGDEDSDDQEMAGASD